MSEALDPRLHAARPDLADARLKGRVSAERFVEGKPARCRAPSAPLRRRPAPTAPLDTELLCGEPVRVFERDGEGFAFVQSETDGYVGYAPSDAVLPGAAPTHRVTAPETLVFPEPEIKAPPVSALPLGAAVPVATVVEGRDRPFARLPDATFVVAAHLSPLGGPPAADWVAFAEALVGTPYLWGGKTRRGIDCSGLVQVALQAAGRTAPRDSDMQEAGLGVPVPFAGGPPPSLVRGDLLFWRGHVGVMVDGERLLHANATHMLTVIEPLSEALARHEAAALPLTTVRRLAA